MAKMKNLNSKKSDWHSINWLEVNQYVSNLQNQMVVAYTHNNMEEVFRLQDKLVMSFKGRALAVRKITSNPGGKTPGVDNIIWNTHIEKYKAIETLKQILLTKECEYKANFVKRVWIPKTNSTKLRPLGIPTLIDRSLQMLIVLTLDPIVEQNSDFHSYGSRKYRGTWDAMTRLRTLLDKKSSPRWIWDADISDCFNQISHEFTMKELNNMLYPKGKVLVYKWLKAGISEKGVITMPTKGIPQGGVISPLLCNLTLNGLENVVRKGYPTDRKSVV